MPLPVPHWDLTQFSGCHHKTSDNVYPAVQFVEKHMTKLREEGVVWGYDIQYLVTGLLNQHPRSAIQFTKDKRTDYSEFYKEIVVQD